MGRKGNFDVKLKKGPGRKAKKQGRPNMKILENSIAKITSTINETSLKNSTTPCFLKR